METQILKSKGIRLTPQRLAVYGLLKKLNRHLSAEEIYARIKQEFPGLSFATVYTILELFKNKDLVKELRIKFNKSCFELRGDPHHHFLCRRCKKIFDIDIPLCLTLKRKEASGHQIQELQGYFYGICSLCRHK
jgi:Fe2+ or Zn2+ uptake regulation protein